MSQKQCIVTSGPESIRFFRSLVRGNTDNKPPQKIKRSSRKKWQQAMHPRKKSSLDDCFVYNESWFTGIILHNILLIFSSQVTELCNCDFIADYITICSPGHSSLWACHAHDSGLHPPVPYLTLHSHVNLYFCKKIPLT